MHQSCSSSSAQSQGTDLTPVLILKFEICAVFTHVMCIAQTVVWCVVLPSPCSADEEQQRDVIRAAAAPPQRAAEERGAGMPRRRRNLAAVMANRRPQREDVEHGTHFVHLFNAAVAAKDGDNVVT